MNEFTPVEKPTPRADTAAAGTDAQPHSVAERKALRREQRRKVRLAIIRRGAQTGCEGFKLLPRAEWKLGNPGPIGLWGMGMTFILYSLHLTGHWDLYAVTLGMMLVFGGGVQIIGGCLQYVRGNTLGYTLFLLNGCFWLSLVGITNLPDKTRPHGPPIVSVPTEYFEGIYYLMWAIVSLCLFAATLRTNLATALMMLGHLVWFILLAIGYMADSTRCVHAAGYTGVVIGGLALYVAYAHILDEVFDRTVLPVVPLTTVWKAIGVNYDEQNR